MDLALSIISTDVGQDFEARFCILGGPALTDLRKASACLQRTRGPLP